MKENSTNVYMLSEYLLNTYYVPGTVWDYGVFFSQNCTL